MSLITPNRLKLGQKNDRSPSGCLRITSDSSKILETNQNIDLLMSKTYQYGMAISVQTSSDGVIHKSEGKVSKRKQKR